MDYELTVDIPTAGDTSVFILGLGEIRNGSTVTVDSERAAQFKNLTGTTLGRAAFQEGVSVKALRGKGSKSEAIEDHETPEPAHVEGTPTPVQNVDGETAKNAKDGDK